MPNVADIKWFKDQFGPAITQAVASTPFDLDMLVALACQETGYIWATLRRKGMAVPDILELCVGDTLDRKSTFPRDRAHLESRPGGAAMFAKARAALLAMSAHIPGYGTVATNPNKFCKGFGVFQYDLQFFSQQTEPFFMGGYADFATSLSRCITELKAAMQRAKIPAATRLTDMQRAAIAIAYNSGSYKPALALKQGYRAGDGTYYGENFYRYLQLAHSVAFGDPAPAVPVPGVAVLPPTTSVDVSIPYVVKTTNGGVLNLRTSPEKKDRPSNILRGLPAGHPVSVLSPRQEKNGFLRIETNLLGAHLSGWAAAKFLSPAATETVAKELAIQLVPDTPALPAAYLPLAAGTIIARAKPANAGSLNEAGQPGRSGATPAELCQSIEVIVDWLDPEKPTHKRYWPRNGLTFCNIYAHDFCHLAGVYLPRVWWNATAIAKLSAGIAVEPRYGATVDELRANDLFRWLRDFGPQFGWRQTGTLTKLQLAANSGGIGLIVARRKEEGKSGHIVIVVPEADERRAKRDTAGEVSMPLQSQAGAKNFRYSTGTGPWWTSAQFAEFSYWIHA